MDFEIERFTRQCHATGQDLGPGEAFFSVVVSEGSQVRRYDYSVEAWPGPPEGAIGWWKSRRNSADPNRRHWAPNDVILDLFDRLEQQPENQDIRYVLALLLVRRRVFRTEENQDEVEGREVLALYCPRRDATYRVPMIRPDQARVEMIQSELARLLQ